MQNSSAEIYNYLLFIGQKREEAKIKIKEISKARKAAIKKNSSQQKLSND